MKPPSKKSKKLFDVPISQLIGEPRVCGKSSIILKSGCKYKSVTDGERDAYKALACDRYHEMTPEEKKKIIARKLVLDTKKTPGQKAIINARRRESYAKKTTEQKELYRGKKYLKNKAEKKILAKKRKIKVSKLKKNVDEDDVGMDLNLVYSVTLGKKRKRKVSKLKKYVDNEMNDNLMVDQSANAAEPVKKRKKKNSEITTCDDIADDKMDQQMMGNQLDNVEPAKKSKKKVSNVVKNDDVVADGIDKKSIGAQSDTVKPVKKRKKKNSKITASDDIADDRMDQQMMGNQFDNVEPAKKSKKKVSNVVKNDDVVADGIDKNSIGAQSDTLKPVKKRKKKNSEITTCDDIADDKMDQQMMGNQLDNVEPAKKSKKKVSNVVKNDDVVADGIDKKSIGAQSDTVKPVKKRKKKNSKITASDDIADDKMDQQMMGNQFDNVEPAKKSKKKVSNVVKNDDIVADGIDKISIGAQSDTVKPVKKRKTKCPPVTIIRSHGDNVTQSSVGSPAASEKSDKTVDSSVTKKISKDDVDTAENKSLGKRENVAVKDDDGIFNTSGEDEVKKSEKDDKYGKTKAKKSLHYMDPSYSRLGAEVSGFVAGITHTRKRSKIKDVHDDKENLSADDQCVLPGKNDSSPVRLSVPSYPVSGFCTPDNVGIPIDISNCGSINESLLSSANSKVIRQSSLSDTYDDVTISQLEESIVSSLCCNASVEEVECLGEVPMQQPKTFDFVPLRANWRKSKCEMLGLTCLVGSLYDPWSNIPDKHGIYVGSPSVSVKSIIGDGNCFYRAISFILTLSQEHHRKIRLKVADYIEEHYTSYARQYRDRNNLPPDPRRIRDDGKWAGNAEQDAIMCLLNTDLYLFQKFSDFWVWTCNRHLAGVRNISEEWDNFGAIYLEHTGGNHFDVVVDVENDLNVFAQHQKWMDERFGTNVADSLDKVVADSPIVSDSCGVFSSPELSPVLNKVGSSEMKGEGIKDVSNVSCSFEAFSSAESSLLSNAPKTRTNVDSFAAQSSSFKRKFDPDIEPSPKSPISEVGTLLVDNSDECLFDFVPVDEEWRKSRCAKFELPVRTRKPFGPDKKSIPNSSEPSQIEHIKADGNCFYSAISWVLTGVQGYSDRLRSKVAEFIALHSSFYESNYTQRDGKAPNPSIIIQDGNYAENGEHHAMMCLLNTYIYIKTDDLVLSEDYHRWQCDFMTGFDLRDGNLPSTNRAIYLTHSHGNHFEVCLDVGVSDEGIVKRQKNLPDDPGKKGPKCKGKSKGKKLPNDYGKKGLKLVVKDNDGSSGFCGDGKTGFNNLDQIPDSLVTSTPYVIRKRCRRLSFKENNVFDQNVLSVDIDADENDGVLKMNFEDAEDELIEAGFLVDDGGQTGYFCSNLDDGKNDDLDEELIKCAQCSPIRKRSRVSFKEKNVLGQSAASVDNDADENDGLLKKMRLEKVEDAFDEVGFLANDGGKSGCSDLDDGKIDDLDKELIGCAQSSSSMDKETSHKSLSLNKSSFSTSGRSTLSRGQNYSLMSAEEQDLYKKRSLDRYYCLTPRSKKELIAKAAKRQVAKRKNMWSSEKKRKLAKRRARYQIFAEKNRRKAAKWYRKLTPNARKKRLKKTAACVNRKKQREIERRRYQLLSSSSKKRRKTYALDNAKRKIAKMSPCAYKQYSSTVVKRRKERFSNTSMKDVVKYKDKHRMESRMSYDRLSPRSKQKKILKEKLRVQKLTPNSKRLHRQRKNRNNARYYKKTLKEKACLSNETDYYWDDVASYSRYVSRGLRRRVNVRRVMVQSFKRAAGFGTWKRWKQSIIHRLKYSFSRQKHVSVFSSQINMCDIKHCVDKTIDSWKVAGETFQMVFARLSAKWRKHNIDYLVYRDSDKCAEEMAKAWGIRRFHAKTNEAWNTSLKSHRYYPMSRFSFDNPMAPTLMKSDEGCEDNAIDLDQSDVIKPVKRRGRSRKGKILDDTDQSGNDSFQSKKNAMAGDAESQDDSFISDVEIKVKPKENEEDKGSSRNDPLIRPCSSQCQVSSDWALIVHGIIGNVCRSADTWRNMLGIVTLEYCEGCIQAKDGADCLMGDNCTDFIKFLSKLQYHFVGIRTLIRCLYDLRQAARYIILCDEILNRAEWPVLKKFVAERRWKQFVCKKRQRFPKRSMLSVETVVKEMFGHLIDMFDLKMEDLPVQVCQVCSQYKCWAELLEKEESEKRLQEGGASMWETVKDMLIEEQGSALEFPIFVCSPCWNKIRIGEKPKFSPLNNMGIDEPPACIKNLNEVERVCVQVAKYFHTIVKLKPLSRRSERYTGLLDAQKGLGIYLPLPRETIMTPFEKSTFLDFQHMDILVDTAPTAQKNIWRYPCNVKLMYEAAKYLKENHPYCANIGLPTQEQIQRALDQKVVQVNIVDNLDDDDELDVLGHVSAGETLGEEKQSGQDSSSKDVVDEDGQSGYCCSNLDKVTSSQPGESANDAVTKSANGSLGEDKECSSVKKNAPEPEPGVRSLFDIVSDKTPLVGYSIQDIDPKAPDLLQDLDLYRMDRVKGRPLYEKKDLNLDVMCFPDLHCKGRFGIDDIREIKVNPGEYAKARMMHSSGYFRRNQRWIFNMSQYKDAQAIKSGIYSTLQMARVGGKTVKEFLENIKRPESELARNVTSALGGVIGSRGWCFRKYSDLTAIDQQADYPCTLFVTFSFSEHWTGLKDFLLKRNPDFIKYVKQDIGFMVAKDPASVTEFFHLRFQAFFNQCVLVPNGVFGTVDNYWYRLEYQARGAPHIHCKLWIADAPVIGVDSPEKIAEWVDSKITCAYPSKDVDPRLHELVTKYQIHRCTSSCIRWYRKRKSCRFQFPRNILEETRVNSVDDVIRSRSRKYGKSVKLVELKRSPNEIYVNDHNAAVLLVYEANVDVQFTSEKFLVINRYCSGYSCKAEKNWTEAVWEGTDSEKSDYSQLLTAVRKSFAKREIGSMEASDRIMMRPVVKSSFQCRYLNTGFKSDRRRRLKSVKMLQELDPDSTDVCFKTLVDTDYPNRPDTDEFNNMCLFDFAALFDITRGKKYVGDVELQNKMGYVHRLKKRYIITASQISPNSEQKQEAFFHQLLLMFHPWRDEAELVAEDGKYITMFNRKKDEMTRLLDEHHRSIRVQEGVDLMESIQREEEAKEENAEGEWDQGVVEIEGAKDSLANVLPDIPVISEEALGDLVGKLNKGQKEAYDCVMAGLKHNQQHIDGSCDCKEPNSVMMFVSGFGGTGKTMLINCVTSSVVSTFEDVLDDQSKIPVNVAIAAPTGIAAINVNGVTLHKMFSLPVKTGFDPQYSQLSSDARKRLSFIFSHVRLIIIDEISMVSNTMLMSIDLRLKEIIRSEEPFGGKNILVMGDFFQLRPVFSEFVFMKLNEKKSIQLFHTPFAYSIWPEFIYAELTENMRQKGDLEWSLILSRCRTGIHEDNDVIMLAKRIVVRNEMTNQIDVAENLPIGNNVQCSMKEMAIYFIQNIMSSESSALALFPLNAKVDGFNKFCMEQLGIETVRLDCSDRYLGGRSKKVRERLRVQEEAKKPKTSETGGLDSVVEIGVKCRVMLRKNLDQAKGLVNGSLGEVTGIRRRTGGRVEEVLVKFDNPPETVCIKRAQSSYELKYGVVVTRSQFPLCPAYAITIHKSQGLTLNAALVDCGDDIFEEGMAYVGLSRVKSLNQLYLFEFNPNQIWCDSRCIREYQRLRKTIKMSYSDISVWNSRGLGGKNCGKFQRAPVSAEESKEKMRNVAAVLPSVYHLKLVNDTESSFADSVVQLLIHMELFMAKLHKEGVLHPALKELLRLKMCRDSQKSEVLDTCALRHHLGCREEHLNLQGIWLFIQKIHERLPLECKRLWAVSETLEASCSVCRTKCQIVVSDTKCYLQPKEPLSGSSIDFGQFLLSSDTLPHNCSFCSEMTNHYVVRSYAVSAKNKYVLIRLSHYDTDFKPLEIKYKNCVSAKQKFGNANYRLIGLIEQKVDNLQSIDIHYVAWIRSSDNKWVKIDGSKCDRVHKLKGNLSLFSLLLWERL